MEERLLVLKEVLSLLRIPTKKLSQLIKRGDFPRPLYLGPRTPRWRESDVRKFIEGSAQ